MTDEELTDAWEAGRVFPGGVSHRQHLRIAWVLHRRHGAVEATIRLLEGTKRSCEVHGCPEKFDAALTERWSRTIGEAIARDGPGATAEEFIVKHPELCRGDLLEGHVGSEPDCHWGEAARVTRRLADWASSRPEIRALAMVGSRARQAADDHSDLDLVLLVDEPERLTAVDDWLAVLDHPPIIARRVFGPITERRVRLPSGLEIEFGIVPLSWAAIKPVDIGTRRVVEEGFRILHDPDQLLARLQAVVETTA